MSEINLKIRSRDIDTLLNILASNNPNVNPDIIKKAYNCANEAHEGQFRLSGEPFIIHPMEVAIILAKLKLDTTSIAAALLHDVVEDTGVTLQFIQKNFGADTAFLVGGVTKMSSIKKRTKYNEQALNLRKMLLTTIRDVRVILIKLADNGYFDDVEPQYGEFIRVVCILTGHGLKDPDSAIAAAEAPITVEAEEEAILEAIGLLEPALV